MYDPYIHVAQNVLCTHAVVEGPGIDTKEFEPVHGKTNNLGSDQVRHKPSCTVAEDG